MPYRKPSFSYWLLPFIGLVTLMPNSTNSKNKDVFLSSQPLASRLLNRQGCSGVRPFFWLTPRSGVNQVPVKYSCNLFRSWEYHVANSTKLRLFPNKIAPFFIGSPAPSPYPHQAVDARDIEIDKFAIELPTLSYPKASLLLENVIKKLIVKKGNRFLTHFLSMPFDRQDFLRRSRPHKGGLTLKGFGSVSPYPSIHRMELLKMPKAFDRQASPHTVWGRRSRASKLQKLSDLIKPAKQQISFLKIYKKASFARLRRIQPSLTVGIGRRPFGLRSRDMTSQSINPFLLWKRGYAPVKSKKGKALKNLLNQLAMFLTHFGQFPCDSATPFVLLPNNFSRSRGSQSDTPASQTYSSPSKELPKQSVGKVIEPQAPGLALLSSGNNKNKTNTKIIEDKYISWLQKEFFFQVAQLRVKQQAQLFFQMSKSPVKPQTGLQRFDSYIKRLGSHCKRGYRQSSTPILKMQHPVLTHTAGLISGSINGLVQKRGQPLHSIEGSSLATKQPILAGVASSLRLRSNLVYFPQDGLSPSGNTSSLFLYPFSMGGLPQRRTFKRLDVLSRPSICAKIRLPFIPLRGLNLESIKKIKGAWTPSLHKGGADGVSLLDTRFFHKQKRVDKLFRSLLSQPLCFGSLTPHSELKATQKTANANFLATIPFLPQATNKSKERKVKNGLNRVVGANLLLKNRFNGTSRSDEAYKNHNSLRVINPRKGICYVNPLRLHSIAVKGNLGINASLRGLTSQPGESFSFHAINVKKGEIVITSHGNENKSGNCRLTNARVAIKKKRRALKQRRNTWSALKRKRFHPRPIWPRVTMYKKFLKHRHNTIVRGLDRHKRPFLRRLRGVPLDRRGRRSRPTKWVNPLKGICYVNPQIFPIFNEKAFYRISKGVLSEFHKDLWKSTWLRLNVNSYLKTINNSLNLIKTFYQIKERDFSTGVSLCDIKLREKTAITKEAPSKWETARRISEYNQITYRRIQQIISNTKHSPSKSHDSPSIASQKAFFGDRGMAGITSEEVSRSVPTHLPTSSGGKELEGDVTRRSVVNPQKGICYVKQRPWNNARRKLKKKGFNELSGHTPLSGVKEFSLFYYVDALIRTPSAIMDAIHQKMSEHPFFTIQTFGNIAKKRVYWGLNKTHLWHYKNLNKKKYLWANQKQRERKLASKTKTMINKIVTFINKPIQERYEFGLIPEGINSTSWVNTFLKKQKLKEKKMGDFGLTVSQNQTNKNLSFIANRFSSNLEYSPILSKTELHFSSAKIFLRNLKNMLRVGYKSPSTSMKNLQNYSNLSNLEKRSSAILKSKNYVKHTSFTVPFFKAYNSNNFFKCILQTKTKLHFTPHGGVNSRKGICNVNSSIPTAQQWVNPLSGVNILFLCTALFHLCSLFSLARISQIRGVIQFVITLGLKFTPLYLGLIRTVAIYSFVLLGRARSSTISGLRSRENEPKVNNNSQNTPPELLDIDLAHVLSQTKKSVGQMWHPTSLREVLKSSAKIISYVLRTVVRTLSHKLRFLIYTGLSKLRFLINTGLAKFRFLIYTGLLKLRFVIYTQILKYRLLKSGLSRLVNILQSVQNCVKGVLETYPARFLISYAKTISFVLLKIVCKLSLNLYFLINTGLSQLIYIPKTGIYSLYVFLAKPSELFSAWITYILMFEVASDLTAIIPAKFDAYVWKNFTRLTKASSLSFVPVVGTLLEKRIFSGFELFLYILSQPNTDIIVREKKGQIFFSNWARFFDIVAAVNKIHVPSLVKREEDRFFLLSKLLEIFETNTLINTEDPSIATLFMGKGNITSRGGANNPSPSTKEKGRMVKYGKKGYHKVIPRGFAFSATRLPSEGPSLAIEAPRSPGLLPAIEAQSAGKKKNGASRTLWGRWSANQFMTYIGEESDLIIESSPASKSLNSFFPSQRGGFLSSLDTKGVAMQAVGISGWAPMGPIICQIYSGIFHKKTAKNVLVVGTASKNSNYDEKSLLIQSLAGEIEMKIIKDNAKEYNFLFGIRLLRKVLETIPLFTPCIFLIEDIHIIGDKRPASIGDNEYEQTAAKNSRIPSTEPLHETNLSNAKLSKHLLMNYQKHYRGGASGLIAAQNHSFSLFLGVISTSSGKEGQGTPLRPIPLELITPSLNPLGEHTPKNGVKRGGSSKSSTSKQSMGLALTPTKSVIPKGFKPRKLIKELPWKGLRGQSIFEHSLPNINYSIRVKVALLARIAASRLFAKLHMITELLIAIDSVRSHRGFVVFATTHTPASLDPALRRPGRFNETIALSSTPKLENRWEIVKSNLVSLNSSFFKNGYVSKKTVDTDSGFPIGLTVDLFDYGLFNLSLSNHHLRTSQLQKTLPIFKRGANYSAGAACVETGPRSSAPPIEGLLWPSAPVQLPTHGGGASIAGRSLPHTQCGVSQGDIPGDRGAITKHEKGSRSALSAFAPKGGNGDSSDEVNPTSWGMPLDRRGWRSRPTSGVKIRRLRSDTPAKVGNLIAIAYSKIGTFLINNQLSGFSRHSSKSGLTPQCGVFPSIASQKAFFGHRGPSIAGAGDRGPHSGLSSSSKGAETSLCSGGQLIPQGGMLPLQDPSWSYNHPQFANQENLRHNLMGLFATRVAETFILSGFGKETPPHKVWVRRWNSFTEGDILPLTHKVGLDRRKKPFLRRSRGMSHKAGLIPERGSASLTVAYPLPSSGLIPERGYATLTHCDRGPEGRQSRSFGPGMIADATWKATSSLICTFIEKRLIYKKTVLFPKFLQFFNAAVQSSSLQDAPSPPESFLLLPAKRYENYQRSFLAMQDKTGTIFDAIQSHQKRVSYFIITTKNHLEKPLPSPLFSSASGTPSQPIDPTSWASIAVRSLPHTQCEEGYLGANDSISTSPLEKGIEELELMADKLKLAQFNACLEQKNDSLPPLVVKLSDLRGSLSSDDCGILSLRDNNAAKPTKVNSNYRSRILNRHRGYLDNQWWNGQLFEQSVEAVALSDIELRTKSLSRTLILGLRPKTELLPRVKIQKVQRLTEAELAARKAELVARVETQKAALKTKLDKYLPTKFMRFFLDPPPKKKAVAAEKKDFFADYPDSDQHYNPRNRRWVLQNGYWSYWYNFQTAHNSEIYSYMVTEAFINTFNLLNSNREILDYFATKILKLGLVEEITIIDGLKRF